MTSVIAVAHVIHGHGKLVGPVSVTVAQQQVAGVVGG